MLHCNVGLLLCGLLFLAGCGVVEELPRWLTGLPTKDELAYSGPIQMPSLDPNGKPWPNLADIPPKPDSTMPMEDRKKLLAEMKKENVEGEKQVEAFVEQQVVRPAPKAVPPKKKKSKKTKHVKKPEQIKTPNHAE